MHTRLRFEHSAKAQSPIEITDEGIVTCVIEEHFKKRQLLIEVK